MSQRKDLGKKLKQLGEQAQHPQGRAFWRTIEEFCELPEFQELMQQEFPEQADIWPEAISRRRFLALMGASLALAGLGGCSVQPAPLTEIVPYARVPEAIVPGRPLFYATAAPRVGGAIGLLVESHEGRPTKIEGNPDHPASLGATDIFAQAEILTLYDPDRAKTVIEQGDVRTWNDAGAMIRNALRRHEQDQGRGLRLLTESTTSPTFGGQIQALLSKYPQARWCQYDPVHRDAAWQAAQWAFDRPVHVRYDFQKADRVLSFDADFLTRMPGSLRYTDQFMSRRRVRTNRDNARTAEMNRMFLVETSVTPTGAKADHRLALRPQEIEALAQGIANQLGLPIAAPPLANDEHQRWLDAVARELDTHRGRSLVVPGENQPAEVHLLAHALNETLGNVGQTIDYLEPVNVEWESQTDALRELVTEMRQGEVETLFILGGNPVYNAPVDFDFARSLEHVPLRVHASLYHDETSALCDWHLPEAHFLEAWGDVRADDGTASIIQPLIRPLHEGRSILEIVALMNTGRDTYGRELVRSTWSEHWQAKQETGGDDFETFWSTSLHDGVVAGTAFEPISTTLQTGWEEHLKLNKSPYPEKPPPEANVLGVIFRPDPTIFDGRYANNAWLQELPKPITRLTWDNAVLLSPQTAAALGLTRGSYAHGAEHGGYEMPIVELTIGDRELRGAVWIMPGHAEGVATLWLGHGRWRAGQVGTSEESTVGFNAYQFRDSQHPWSTSGVQLRTTGQSGMLACVQAHHLMEGREIVRSGTLDEYQQHPARIAQSVVEEMLQQAHLGEEPLSFYEPFNYEPPKHKWGMSIDLTTCIGCQACVIACQAENNIPVVGKEQVLRGREMHWIRVDRYIQGTPEKPEAFYFQPVPCMHCEHAPCEYVCPVAATVHSAEGLNDMLYQRCIGTRFCSNNCPYKVRRFNFLEFAEWKDPLRRLQYNPDVTVRSRGVMEKCTYCVQRIRQAEINADIESRPLGDGEVLTACQAVCPAKAIVFGDINDPESQVHQWKESPLHYGLLAELNTTPRTTYLGALINPDKELKAHSPHVAKSQEQPAPGRNKP